MHEKITAISQVTKEFIKYLDSKQGDPRQWYFALVQVMRHNANKMLGKLEVYNGFLERNGENKLKEHVARLQETIQSCLSLEKLEYKAASAAYSSIVLEKCTVLERLDKKLKEVMPYSHKQVLNPKKHWLSEEWKKIEAGLHMGTALEILFENINKDNMDLCKTVLFSEKARSPVTRTTSKTRSLTQHFDPYLKKELEAFEQKSEFALKLVSTISPRSAKL